MSRTAFTSERGALPIGAYSSAMEACGLVFLAGQTPRDRDNVRHGAAPFAVQARMALDNLEAAANAAGLSLKDAVRVGVFLRDPANAAEFDVIYREYVVEPFSARTLAQSNLPGFDLEVDAVPASTGREMRAMSVSLTCQRTVACICRGGTRARSKRMGSREPATITARNRGMKSAPVALKLTHPPL